MLGLFKKIGKVLLYIVEVPIFIIALALFAVVGLIGIIILFIKSIFLFFTGRSLYDDLPEDKKAKEIIRRNSPDYKEEQPVQNPVRQEAPQVASQTPVYPQPQPTNNYQNVNNQFRPAPSQQNLEEFVFEDEQSIPEPEPEIAQSPQINPSFSTKLQENPQPAPQVEPEESDSFEILEEPKEEEEIHVDDMIDDMEEEEEIGRYVPDSNMFDTIDEPKQSRGPGVSIDFDEEDR